MDFIKEPSLDETAVINEQLGIDVFRQDPETARQQRRLYEIDSFVMEWLMMPGVTRPINLRSDLKRWAENCWANLVNPPDELHGYHFHYAIPENGM